MEREARWWRWANVPVPEPHVVGLFVGAILQGIVPLRACPNRRHATVAGSGLIAGSLLVVAWSVRTWGQGDTEAPAGLVTGGPYARSRNPMYVAWTGLYAGVALVVNSAWPLALLPAVAVGTHAVVRAEERSLERAFGDEYRSYRRRVPRYV